MNRRDPFGLLDCPPGQVPDPKNPGKCIPGVYETGTIEVTSNDWWKDHPGTFPGGDPFQGYGGVGRWPDGGGGGGDDDGGQNERDDTAACMSRSFAPVAGVLAAAGGAIGSAGAVLFGRGKQLGGQATALWGPVKHVTRVLSFPTGALIARHVVGQTAGNGLMRVGSALGITGLAVGAGALAYVGTTYVACRSGAL